MSANSEDIPPTSPGLTSTNWLDPVAARLMAVQEQVRAGAAAEIGLQLTQIGKIADDAHLSSALISAELAFGHLVRALELETDAIPRKAILHALNEGTAALAHKGDFLPKAVAALVGANLGCKERFLNAFAKIVEALSETLEILPKLIAIAPLCDSRELALECLEFMQDDPVFVRESEAARLLNSLRPANIDDLVDQYRASAGNLCASRDALCIALRRLPEPKNMIDNPEKLANWQRKPKLDLSGTFFLGSTLGFHLQGVSLSRAILIGTGFLADLRGAHLECANIAHGRFSRVMLDGTRFGGAILRQASFKGASMRHCSLTGCNAIGANFRDADLRHAVLWNSNLSEANFEGAELGQAKLADTTIDAPNFQPAMFEKSNWSEADFWKSTRSPGRRRRKDQDLKKKLVKLQRASGLPLVKSRVNVAAASETQGKVPSPSPAPVFRVNCVGGDLHDLTEHYAEILAGLTGDVDDAASALCRALHDLWIDKYLYDTNADYEGVDVFDIDGFTYILDGSESSQIRHEVAEVAMTRVIAAYGRAQPARKERADYYMQGPLCSHPDEDETLYDRGHFIGYAIGGIYQFNLYPQRRDVNQGISDVGRVYAAMERYARHHPGTFVFARGRYRDLTAHPSIVEYGLLKEDGELWTLAFDNIIGSKPLSDD